MANSASVPPCNPADVVKTTDEGIGTMSDRLEKAAVRPPPRTGAATGNCSPRHLDCPGETLAEGLDGLPTRLFRYVEIDAAFAKWCAVYTITDRNPSPGSVRSNAYALTRSAAACQAPGIVPIVAP